MRFVLLGTALDRSEALRGTGVKPEWVATPLILVSRGVSSLSTRGVLLRNVLCMLPVDFVQKDNVHGAIAAFLIDLFDGSPSRGKVVISGIQDFLSSHSRSSVGVYQEYPLPRPDLMTLCAETLGEFASRGSR